MERICLVVEEFNQGGSSWPFINDSAKDPVTHFCHRQLGIIRAGQPPSQEIFTARKDMVDLIVVMSMYMEKVQEDKNSKGGERT